MRTVAAILFAISGLARAEPVVVELQTDLGEIVVALDIDRAPRTAANFLRYVDLGLLDGTSFYRVVRPANQPQNPVKIAVIQGGLGDEGEQESLLPIRMESTEETGLRHLDGVISMARLGPDTARGDFFICVGDQPELDAGGRRNPDGFGFAAFGRVTEGMDVVHRIHQAPAEGQTLVPSVGIITAGRRGSVGRALQERPAPGRASAAVR